MAPEMIFAIIILCYERLRKLFDIWKDKNEIQERNRLIEHLSDIFTFVSNLMQIIQNSFTDLYHSKSSLTYACC